MTIQYANIDDAVLLTQEKLINRGSFLDHQTDLTDFVAVRELWKGKRKVFDGGDDWEFQAQIDHNHSARAVGLYETDGGAIADTMITMKVQPRHLNAFYHYDQREPAFQRGGTKIVDLVQTRVAAMQISLFELMESILWTKPDDSDDDKTPFGMTYWVTKCAAEGFNGLDPAGFPLGRAGKSSAAYPRWANYGSPYVAVSKEDLVRRMRRGSRQTKFRSPLSHATPKVGGMKNGIYTNDGVIGIMEEILEDQNMNLGNDLASKDGRTLFKGTPVQYVPKLDDDVQNPIYTIDWLWMAIGVLAGWENQLTKPYMVPNKHTVRRVDNDCTLQMICTDLRRQGVYHVAD